MSDYNSSLPVRTENAGDVIAKIADATVPSQQLTVNPDGSINTNSVVTATDLDIRDLNATQDNVAISDGTDQLEVNADGSINAVVTATDLDIRDLDFATDSVDVTGSDVTATVTATDLDIRDLAFATDKVDVSGSDVTATVTATDLDIRDLDAAQDSVESWIVDEAGNPFSATNPLPVTISESEGTEINNYATSAAVAAAASANHDYTAVGNFTFTQFSASASGKCKIVVAIETAAASGTFNTRFVMFNSTANPNMEKTLREPILVTAGVRVRITRTNLDNQAQDLYSTISGHEA